MSDSPNGLDGKAAELIRGLIIPTVNGKLLIPGGRIESAEEERKSSAALLIKTIVCAACEIGATSTINQYDGADFQLPAATVAHLLNPEHPSFSKITKLASLNPKARVSLKWPEFPDDLFDNELLSDPLAIVAELMHRIVSGDATFFEEIAKEIKAAKLASRKRRGKRGAGLMSSVENAASINKTAGAASDAVADQLPISGEGSTQANAASYSSHVDVEFNGMYFGPTKFTRAWGDATIDWFSPAARPSAKSTKAKPSIPWEVWRYCAKCHKHGAMPTRRNIRDALAKKGLSPTNLRVILARMRLDHLDEGERIRSKRNTET